ncbi:NAD(P)/FAD-dependent oxidoreductase [Lentiprolixibacter aurantiacus]|uniref:FAD-dependent oxidoreductase n=1 Tax=Lentiprolixibacter aurantiacus TaxID=2993939 RepID=A0AAE3MJL2_9FLAO|nr:FAD-dependent oxidoreductase [Lentiprolixibacter aurantiacus]MCX2718418.1 FAD-dependent oxidoreductase [Lentiprolixibacter aurantiacus]
MELSYWEHKSWFSDIDYTVVGSGIVGLSCALHIKKIFPDARVLVLEKGILPQGASTKNAGFACFGSISEILDDLRSHSEDEVMGLVEQRYRGILLLREILGDTALGYQKGGGHELFLYEDKQLYGECLEALGYINKLMNPVFGQNAFERLPNTFGFNKIVNQYITNPNEGSIDTGNMMLSLLGKVHEMGVLVLNSVSVTNYECISDGVKVYTDGFDFKSGKLLIATNGFASGILGNLVKPARAQVLITEPVKDLHIRGTFHLEHGYYYFRSVGNRILLGGGRNLDFKAEETTEFGQTGIVQDRLEYLLEEVILPGKEFQIAHRWSGIMGVGPQKKPVIKQLEDHVYCGVRMGGMGIAIGSIVGKELAEIAQ